MTKATNNLQRMLVDVRENRIGFSTFVAGTRDEYRAMACHLLRRWSVPEWFTAEDVEQELYVETWRVVWTFDASRGVPLHRYVVFNAMAAAKRAMHKARGVAISGTPDKKPSRFEAPVTRLEARDRDSGRSLIEAIEDDTAPADELLVERETRAKAATAALAACTTQAERYAVLAIREAGSVDTAAEVLYEDMDHRIALRLGSEEIAERFVRKHAGAVARRAHRIIEASTRVDA